CSSFFFASRRRHTRFSRDWSSDVCSSDLMPDVDGRTVAVERTLHDLDGAIDTGAEAARAGEEDRKWLAVHHLSEFGSGATCDMGRPGPALYPMWAFSRVSAPPLCPESARIIAGGSRTCMRK